jgi:hypothetical protein
MYRRPKMKEIRICWAPDITHEPQGVFRDGGLWYADFFEPRRALTLIVKAENAKHGSNTHWIEERTVGESGPPA